MPLLDGGELFADKSKGSNIELSNQLFVTDKGGTIDNNGVNLILEGSIQSIGDISDAPSPLFFEIVLTSHPPKAWIRPPPPWTPTVK